MSITGFFQPKDHLDGHDICPGNPMLKGATIFSTGVNFSIASHGVSSVSLCLFPIGSTLPFLTLPLSDHYRFGDVWSVFVFGLSPDDFEYAYCMDSSNFLLDPYATGISGLENWGQRGDSDVFYRGRAQVSSFSWGDTLSPRHPISDLIIYELHLRGFTNDPSSLVAHRVTYLGVVEKIPYLKSLGINAVELLPIFEFDEVENGHMVDGVLHHEYWGYNPVNFFSPKASYASSSSQPGDELRHMIQCLHDNEIEIILDVVYNHTGEAGEDERFFSFKGIDNRTYYILNDHDQYMNYTGCGNTLNANHPMVLQLILDSLRYWVSSYHVDGFRFDLASILCRGTDGNPLDKPPLLDAIANDPLLADVKLIVEP